MRARILSLDSDEHREAQRLLPWFVNETLSPAEASSVATHLAQCSRCRVAADEQAELRVTATHFESDGDVERGWALLRSRIEATPRPAPPRPAPPRPAETRPGRWQQWLPWTVALQTAVLLALTIVLVGRPRDENYRTLGAKPVIEPNAAVVFRRDATNQQMREALGGAGARIVGGPTVTGAYLLSIPTVRPEAVARLRAQSGILSVEALQGDGSP